MHKGPIRLIIISGKPDERKALKNLLAQESAIECVINEAATGKEGLELSENIRCDCILMDQQLPDMDSMEYLRRSSDSTRRRKIPVILITDKGSEHLGHRAIEAGASDFLVRNDLDRERLKLTLYRAIEKNRTDRAERANRKFLDSVIDLIPYPVFYKDAEGRYAGCNSAFEDFRGMEKARIIGSSEKEIMPAEFAGLNSAKDRELLAVPGSQSFPAHITGTDGKDHDVVVNKATLLRNDKSVAGIVGVIIDITERKKVKDKLRQLSRAVEQSPATVVITDVEGNIEYTNPKFTRLTGYTAQEALGNNPRILKSGAQPAEFYREMWNTIRDGLEWRGEFHNVKKNGEPYWESASISPILDEEGTITHYLAVKEDITERKKAEEALRVSEEKLRERNEIMEMDLKIAQLTQNALVIKELPESPLISMDYRYIPLEMVGGDYFSFTPMGGDAMGVFIGDVAGHGVVSALFLALTKFATEKILKEFGTRPPEYLERLNRELIGYMSSYFITGIYGIFESSADSGNCSFRFSSGGHPAPIWLKAGGEIEFTDAPGTIIGALENARYGEKTISLQKGDRLFLYTDGIPEAGNPSRERLGFDEALLELFKASNRPSLGDTLDLIIEGVEKYRNNEPAEDDIILIGIEVK